MDPHRRLFLRIAGGAFAAAGASCHDAAPRVRRNFAERVVSLSPNTTETLFAVGGGNLVVGRSRFCDYPPEVTQLPSVGGYIDTSLEAVLALAPDLVVGARGPAGPGLTEKLGALGIATFFPQTESMAEIEAMIVDLATKVGHHAQGVALVEELTTKCHAITRAVANEPRVRVLLVFGITPIVVAGPESFPNEMIDLAHGENVVTTGGAYPMLSVERLLTLRPDVVLNAAMAGAPGGDSELIRRDDPGWRELAAVREGRVKALADEAVLRPGPRIANGLATIARALHPMVNVP